MYKFLNSGVINWKESHRKCRSYRVLCSPADLVNFQYSVLTNHQ